MYKKIKNSSFMNLLWFLIAVLPLLFFAIYSISFFDKEKKEITYISYSSLENLFTYDDVVETQHCSVSSSIIYLDNNDNYRDLSYIVFNVDLVNGSTYRLYYSFDYPFNRSNFSSSVQYFSFIDDNYEDTPLISSYDYSSDYSYIDITYDSSKPYFAVGIDIYNFNSSLTTDSILTCYLFLTDYFDYTFTQEDLRNSTDLVSLSYSSLDTKNIYNNFNDYLEAFNNSIFTNGFIANMFISLLNYFNVSSIYLRIFSYYLEYLILISLLHLAFDFVLLVPNICHKFMERVGGERD